MEVRPFFLYYLFFHICLDFSWENSRAFGIHVKSSGIGPVTGGRCASCRLLMLCFFIYFYVTKSDHKPFPWCTHVYKYICADIMHVYVGGSVNISATTFSPKIIFGRFYLLDASAILFSPFLVDYTDIIRNWYMNIFNSLPVSINLLLIGIYWETY